MTGFRFQAPLWLLLLLPLLIVGVLAIRRQRQAAILYSDVAILRSLPVTVALRLKRWLPWVRLLGLALLILAMARPQHGREEFRVRTEGVAIQMCIDRSGSMRAMDFQLQGRRCNRLEAVKEVFRNFVAGSGGSPGRPDDLIGLVAFGGYADSKCPLTLDHGALLEVLDTVEIPKPIEDARGRVINASLLEEEMATAIGDALTLAVDRLKDVAAKSKVVIFLSDGENTAGVIDPAEAAKTAKTYGIKVYTIGVGTTGRAPIPVVDDFGREVLVSGTVRLDEKTLTMLAQTTGGRYFHAQDTQALEEVYAEIDRLEKTISEGRLYTEYRELYQYAMFPGLALILLEIVLACTRFRSLP
ncbi:MAG: VWA domain-containing protein [Pirellulales bacterium]|nr:VWA domain-containing protein [Pirellulales bacterium]